MGNIAGDKMFSYIERVLNDQRPITADISSRITVITNVRIVPMDAGNWMHRHIR